MHDPTSPEIRESIKFDLERQGYRIESSRIPVLWTRTEQRSRVLYEGMVFRDREPIMAIMKAREAYLVVTATHGAYEGAPYLIGNKDAGQATQRELQSTTG